MDITDKAQSLSDKMNKLTEKFDLSDELVTTGEDVEDFIKEKTQTIELFKESIPQVEVINLEVLTEDFVFIRNTLKECTDNGRRILNVITCEILDADANDEKRLELISAYGELNTAICNDVKMYMTSYGEISKTLLNFDKYIKQIKEEIDETKPNTINNTFNISTTDLVKSLKDKRESS